jgi:hypothetical protein
MRIPFFLLLIFSFFSVPPCSQEKTQEPLDRAVGQASISYRFQRGLDERQEEWLVFPDGVVARGRMQVGRVSQDKVSALLGEISKSGFFQMRRRFRRQRMCHQCSSYRIIVRTGKIEKTVEYQDGSQNIPAGLLETASKIRHLLREVSS